jgi:serine/threonine protein kinase
MKGLRHPNIVRIFTSYYVHGALNIIMEYVDGSALADRYARCGSVPERVLGRIAWLCLEALAYLRLKHVLHRDFKPSNILISDGGELKVCDFGLATQMAASEEERSTAAGTLKYWSPERLREKPYKYAADLWSLGMVIYEGAAGKYPLEGVVLKRDLQERIEGGLDYNVEGYSEEFRGFLRHCLELDQDKRLGAENRRQSWAGRFENDGQEDLLRWIQETRKAG